MVARKLHKLSRNSTLHDQTYSELRSAIMAARFAPGEKLTVRGVAEELGVSAMPVRAAFTRLLAEKAVVLDANGTIEIPKMTRERYEELVMLRALLEGKAAELAAGKVTKKELARLERIGAELTKAARDGDAETYINANQQFKFGIVSAAKSPALADIVQHLWLQVGPFMRFHWTDVRAQSELDRHEEAIEALRAGNGEAAREAIERDILDGADYLFERAADL